MTLSELKCVGSGDSVCPCVGYIRADRGTDGRREVCSACSVTVRSF